MRRLLRGAFADRDTTAWVRMGVGLGLTAVALVLYASGAFHSLDLDTVDTRFSIRGDKPVPDDIVVVQIDDKTFTSTDLQWPFPRSVHAQVIDNLVRDGAEVIAYDVQFSEPTTPKEDNALVAAVSRARNVVLGTSETGPNGEPNVFGGGDVLERINARAGSTNFRADPGGIERRVDYEIDGLKTFGLVATEELTGRRIERSDLPDGGRAWIDFVGSPGRIRSVSFVDVLRERISPDFFAGKVAVVGASAPSLQDLHKGSTTGGEFMSGPELQANVIQTARAGFPLKEAPGAVDVLLIVLLGMAGPLATLRPRGRAPRPARVIGEGVMLALAAGLLFLIGAQLAFDSGVIVSVIYPLAALAFGTVGTIALQAIVEAFERERVRGEFARFVGENVADQVTSLADGIRLGGEEVEGTLLFSDLRGFTSYSEELPAEQVIEVLNRYLTEMTEAILDNGGTLTAFMGDGIMALFGAPIEQDDHADRAVATAAQMLRRLEAFNAWVVTAGLGPGFRMGIGVNSGKVMVGGVGSERRLDYTAIGDTVNTASRLEGMTKGTPYQVFIADSTRAMLRRSPPELVEVGDLDVRGRDARVKVWAFAGEDGLLT